MDSIRRLEEIFGHFPGIGPRQAKRFVYHILHKSPAAVKELADLVLQVKKSSSECSKCHRYFMGSGDICAICKDPTRDQSTLMVVARDSDFESIEKSKLFNGLYFILGGTVPILDKEPEKRIRLKLLLERVSGLANLKEVILSFSSTPEAEHTATIVKEAIEHLRSSVPLKISLLGRGMSTGAELEYVDEDTIKNALKNRF